MKLLAAAPLFAAIKSRGIAATVAAAQGKSSSSDVYTRLGVRPFINARGTWTYLSGSLELPEVRQAVEAASQHFVDMFELQHAVGRRLAELRRRIRNGHLWLGRCDGCRDSRLHSRLRSENIWQLPDTEGLKHEVVMLGGRSAFDSAIRLAGAKLVLAHGVDHLQSAITPQTAMVYTTMRDDALPKPLPSRAQQAFPCCWMMQQAFPRLTISAATQKWASISTALAAEKVAWAAMFRHPARPKNSDRSGSRQLQPLGRLRMQADESR